jgi:uncharacterized circularly permuted ATP-grasp superfamily protein
MNDTADAIRVYHALLEDDRALAQASAEKLAGAQPGACLTFGDTPLCSVLRPSFLTPAAYSYIQSACHTLAAAMFRLAEQMPDDPELLEPMGLTPEERDLIAVDPGFRPISPTTRLDSFLGPDAWYFVEYNAETPAAIAYEDHLTELFFQLPVMQAFRGTHSVTALPARHRLLGMLLGAYKQWGGSEKPSIAIVDWAGLPTATEFELFARYFRQEGLRVTIAEPRDLRYNGRRLYAGDTPVDLIYRRVLTAELLQQPEVAEPLVRAYKAHHVCVVNSFRAKLLHKKMIFALLSDDRYARYFDDAERRTIRAHVPWTRQVADGPSTYQDRHIDLLPFIRDHRDRLVLKPNDEYGGKGVVIGWERSQSEWEAALADALAAPSVVQERVPVAKERFPVWRDGELAWPELAVDLDPFLFGTEVGGALTRLSAAALLNVTAGTGSLAPTVLVEP